MSNQEKNERPICYTPNNDPYPLCKGNEKALYNCKHCCLYEDMDEPYDYI